MPFDPPPPPVPPIRPSRPPCARRPRLGPSTRPFALRALVFDMDGTILDTRAWHMRAWDTLIERHGFPADYKRIANEGFGKTNWRVFNEWFGHAGAAEFDYDALSMEKESYFRELIHGHCIARPGFHELLDRAQWHGLRIALATSGPRENAEFVLRELGVRAKFDLLVCGDSRLRSKPHPDAFALAARKLRLPPRQCAGFEDSRHGFWSVRRAGMELIAIAENKDDVGPNRRWTRWSFSDFRPIVRWLA